MDMPGLFECRKCGRKFRIPDAVTGKVYRCAGCSTIMDEYAAGDIDALKAESVELMLGETVPQQVQSAMQNPENVYGRYVILEPIGKGAAGEVFRAYDLELQRFIALKFINMDRIETLRNEARLLAALDHKNIARIYDIGASRNRGFTLDAKLLRPAKRFRLAKAPALQAVSCQGFIAMQLVKGDSLDGKKLPVEHVLKIISAVCEAVAAAHSAGILHRDIKPANVMLDETGSVFVMDFGIATRNPRLGEIYGTPGYIAPEIAGGSPATERSDIFSIGATMYHLLSRSPPIEFTNTKNLSDVIVRSAEGITIPIERAAPTTPREVAAIVGKATATNPDTRYESASRLADDIRRYLRGEPVSAYSSTITYRSRKFVKQRRFLLALIAIAIFALGLFIFTRYQEWVEKNRNEEALAKKAEEERQAREGKVRKEEENRKMREHYIQLIREITASAMEKVIGARKEGRAGAMRLAFGALKSQVELTYEQANKYAPDLAEPDFLMGRIHRAMLSWKQATEFQEKALVKQPEFAPSLYEIAILLSRRFYDEYNSAKFDIAFRKAATIVQQSGKIEAQEMKEFSEPTRDEILAANPSLARMERRIDDALALLESGSGSVNPAARDAAMGIKEAYKLNLDSARALLQKALAEDAGLEEVYEALAFISSTYDEREMLYRKGIKNIPGYQPFYNLLGECLHNRGDFLASRGMDPIDAWEDADRVFADAAKMDDEDIVCLLDRGNLHNSWGAYLAGKGKQTGAFDRYSIGLRCFSDALKLDSGNTAALLRRGGIHVNAGNLLNATGRDPLVSFDSADKDITQVITATPSDSFAWVTRGIERINKANYLMRTGGDGYPILKDAEDDLGKAIALAPRIGRNWYARGTLRVNRGTYAIDRGIDPSQDLDLAVADFTEALKCEPQNLDSMINLGLAIFNRGLYVSNFGTDPTPHYAEAEKWFTSALKVNPESADALMRRGSVYLNQGILCHPRGGTLDYYDKAEKDLKRAAQIHPGSGDVLILLGHVFANRGRFKNVTGGEPASDWATADKFYSDALDAMPGNSEVLTSQGLMFTERADYCRRNKLDPFPDCDRAEAVFDEAIRINKGNHKAWIYRGVVLSNRGLWEMDGGGDPFATWKRAESDLQKAVELNPREFNAWNGLGTLNFNRGNILNGRGEDPSDAWKESEGNFTEALRIIPASADVFIKRGQLHSNFGLHNFNQGEDPAPQYLLSEADYASALRILPDDSSTLLRLGDTSFNFGLHLERSGKLSEAAAKYETAVEKWSKSASLNPAYKASRVQNIALAKAKAAELRKRSGEY